MAETGARQAALRFAHQRHHLSALDGLTPERIRRSSELRGSRTRSHRAAAAKDEDRRPGAEFLNERLGVRGNVPKGWHAVIVQRRSPGPVSCLKGCIVRHGHVARLAPHSNGQGSREWAIPTQAHPRHSCPKDAIASACILQGSGGTAECRLRIEAV